MAAYDDFAWFYNRYWNEEFHGYAFPILEQIWLARLAPGARILDVCCGTGYLAALLTARGFRVTGIDISCAMLQHARENASQADFVLGDITELAPAGPFDAAVSTFDSLNHILIPGQLEAVFGHIAAVLQPQALFVFDMLLEAGYQTPWEPFALVRDDHVLTITGSAYDFRTRLGRCTITMFRLLEGTWHRSDLIVQERCYFPDEIEKALHSAGFGEILCYDAGDLGMAGQLGEGRTFFVTTRL